MLSPTQGKMDLLKFSALLRTSGNELGRLKECLVGGTKKWIYFETLFERILSNKYKCPMPPVK